MVMTFKVATGDSEGRATHWFASFLADLTIHYEYPGQPIQEWLDKHDARASAVEFVNIGDPLIFESEHDYLMFIMKWA
jgi:hypothetical protein